MATKPQKISKLIIKAINSENQNKGHSKNQGSKSPKIPPRLHHLTQWLEATTTMKNPIL